MCMRANAEKQPEYVDRFGALLGFITIYMYMYMYVGSPDPRGTTVVKPKCYMYLSALLLKSNALSVPFEEI